MSKEKKAFFTIIGILFTIFVIWFYLNYLRDYSSSLKKIGEPMRNNIIEFYKQNKRYPDYSESQHLLETSGCSEVKRAYEHGSSSNRLICSFDIREILIDIYIGTQDNPYQLTFRKELSYCRIDFEHKGKASSVYCNQLPFIRISA